MFAKAGVRLGMPEFLLGRGAYSDVVREAQEPVALAPKEAGEVCRYARRLFGSEAP